MAFSLNGLREASSYVWPGVLIGLEETRFARSPFVPYKISWPPFVFPEVALHLCRFLWIRSQIFSLRPMNSSQQILVKPPHDAHQYQPSFPYNCTRNCRLNWPNPASTFIKLPVLTWTSRRVRLPASISGSALHVRSRFSLYYLFYPLTHISQSV
jgi:hypothetical protein